MSFVLAFPARLQEHKVFRSHLYILKLENFSLIFSDLEGKQNHFRIYDNYHLQKEETCSFTAMYYKELNTNKETTTRLHYSTCASHKTYRLLLLSRAAERSGQGTPQFFRLLLCQPEVPLLRPLIS